MNHQRLQAQRDYLAGKIVVGVDPAKDTPGRRWRFISAAGATPSFSSRP